MSLNFDAMRSGTPEIPIEDTITAFFGRIMKGPSIESDPSIPA